MSNRANAAALGLMVWIILSDAPLFPCCMHVCECMCWCAGVCVYRDSCVQWAWLWLGGGSNVHCRPFQRRHCVCDTPYIEYACTVAMCVCVCECPCVCVSALVCVPRWFVFIAAPGRHQLCCSGFVEAEQRQRLMENNNSTLLLFPAS